MRVGSASPIRALVLFHGRGASADDIIRLADQIKMHGDVIVLAPQAPGYAWYPQTFLAPRANNEPFLSVSLDIVDRLIESLGNNYGIMRERIIIFGFSQGACLAAEYVKRHSARWGGVVIASGGLVGIDSEAAAFGSNISLSKTPIYFGCDNVDLYIPADRVRLSADVFKKLGADVTMRFYDGLGHALHPEGVLYLEALLKD